MDYKNHLTSILGIEIYPLISLTIFFIFFIILVIMVFKMRKPYINEMKQMPLEDDKPIQKNVTTQP